MEATTIQKTDHPQQGQIVKITVNRVTYEIHRGRQTVKAIKELANIALADQLELVACGYLEPLSDDGVVTLKGGEVFLSHPRDGGSS